MEQKLKHYLDNSNFRKSTKGIKKKNKNKKIEDNNKIKEILTINNEGEIVVNEDNMYINTDRKNGMEILEDDKIVTSATHGKKGKSHRWSERETKKFYKALEICGTEFSLISSLFENKTRKHVKAKYLKEVKSNPEKIKSLLKENKLFDSNAYNQLKEY